MLILGWEWQRIIVHACWVDEGSVICEESRNWIRKTGREGDAESLTGLQGRTGGKGIVVYYFGHTLGQGRWGGEERWWAETPHQVGAALKDSAGAWAGTEMLLSRIRRIRRSDNSLTGTWRPRR